MITYLKPEDFNKIIKDENWIGANDEAVWRKGVQNRDGSRSENAMNSSEEAHNSDAKVF